MSDGITLPDLAGLPPAQAIEEYSHATIVDQMIASYRARWDALRAQHPELPTFDTLELESDTTRKNFQEVAFRETLLRARINDAIRSNLLFYAQGTDLDHLVIFYDVLRLFSEQDAALKSRTVLAIAGRSPGGPEPRYRAIARGADVRVADAVVYRIGRDPTIHVAIYSTDNAGLADAELIAKVQAALDHPDVRLVNDTIVVRAAVFSVVDVEADIWLLPSTSDSILTPPSPTTEAPLAAALRRAWSSETGLGFDFVAEWAQARLMAPGSGVRKALLLTPAVVAEPYQAISLGEIRLNNRGRSY